MMHKEIKKQVVEAIENKVRGYRNNSIIEEFTVLVNKQTYEEIKKGFTPIGVSG